jgi:hypothetical protein
MMDLLRKKMKDIYKMITIAGFGISFLIWEAFCRFLRWRRRKNGME